MSENLAIKGGKPVRTKLFPAYNTIGKEEKAAVQKVLDSGNLSQFLGTLSPDFLGGPMVRLLEDKWCEAVGVNHAVSVNSNTSGLFAAMGAIGVKPGDEVIVSPIEKALACDHTLAGSLISYKPPILPQPIISALILAFIFSGTCHILFQQFSNLLPYQYPALPIQVPQGQLYFQ